jgi:hypothetical protein
VAITSLGGRLILHNTAVYNLKPKVYLSCLVHQLVSWDERLAACLFKQLPEILSLAVSTTFTLQSVLDRHVQTTHQIFDLGFATSPLSHLRRSFVTIFFDLWQWYQKPKTGG